MPLDCQRPLFDIPDDVTYLNSASQSPCLRTSWEAGRNAVGRKAHPWSNERGRVAGEMTRCRELFGGLVGATGGDVAVVFTTSYGVAAAAANLPLARNQTVVMLAGQFPSNYYSWRLLAERVGARVAIVPRPVDFDWTSAVLAAIGPETGIVALPNCHYADGSLVDLAAIGGRCREVGAALFVDATQSLGVRDLDAAAIGADFVVASAYKWLLCPDMMGFMYVAPHRQDGQPVEHNHSSRAGGDPIEVSAGYSSDYAPGARRFDMGAADSMVHLPMCVTALEQIRAWGPAAIAAYLRVLVDRIADAAEARGFRVPPPAHRSDHFIGLWPARPLPDDLTDRLRQHRVFVSVRSGAIRVSPYLFNTGADIDRLFRALDACLDG